MRIYRKLPALVLLCAACTENPHGHLREGEWHAQLEVMDGRELPFTFRLHSAGGSYQMQLINASEVIDVDSIRFSGDSIHIPMPVFEGYIAGTYTDSQIKGSFIKESLDRVVPFSATFGRASRFPEGAPALADVSGTWETVFTAEGGDSYPAQGLFEQQGNEVTGTFRTTKGDYRYLQGVMSGDSLKLSTFDGAHAYLFAGRLKDGLISGYYYSGNHYREAFTARRNPDFKLPDEKSLTVLKEGNGKFSFSFPDAEGKLLSLADTEFQDKVVIVQLMGTWCPNCLDETRFLVPFFEAHRQEGLEVVALAFEYAKTKEKAFKGIRRLREREGVAYPVLLAQYGSSNKVLANQKLPMLNHVMSYPTTLVIGREGEVRRIYTGFNGPATGDAYEKFKTEFGQFVGMLLSE